MALHEKLHKAPSDVPAVFADRVNLLEEPLRRVLNLYTIPYSIQAKFAENEWTTYSDLACIWDTPALARTQAPADLLYAEDEQFFVRTAP